MNTNLNAWDELTSGNTYFKMKKDYEKMAKKYGDVMTFAFEAFKNIDEWRVEQIEEVRNGLDYENVVSLYFSSEDGNVIRDSIRLEKSTPEQIKYRRDRTYARVIEDLFSEHIGMYVEEYRNHNNPDIYEWYFDDHRFDLEEAFSDWLISQLPKGIDTLKEMYELFKATK